MTVWRERPARDGFAVLQLLIVAAIVVAVAAIGYPVYAGRSRDLLLEQNQRSLAQQVRSLVVLEADPCDQAQSMRAGAGRFSVVSARLAAALGGEAGRYVNPVSASPQVVCQRRLPAQACRPAVWITDDPRFAHALQAPARVALPSLTGTLVVAFGEDDTGGAVIDVYYFDRSGRPGESAEHLAY